MHKLLVKAVVVIPNTFFVCCPLPFSCIFCHILLYNSPKLHGYVVDTICQSWWSLEGNEVPWHLPEVKRGKSNLADQLSG